MEHEAEKNNRKEWKDYHENGVLAAEGHYSKGEEMGTWRYYDEQGRLEDEEVYEQKTMKKITLGIAILLFAIVLALCSSGMDWLILIVGVAGLLFSIAGFFDKSN